MPTVLRFRRGDTTASNAFTGAEGELYIDTTKDTVVVHDGVTAGGKPLATEAALTSGLAGKQNTLVSGTSIKTVNGTSLLGSGNIVISGGGGGDLTQVSSDITPSFDAVYDIGSSTNQFYDAYLSNKLVINNVSLIGHATLVTPYQAYSPGSTTTNTIAKTFTFVNGTTYAMGNSLTCYSATAGDEWNTWAEANWNKISPNLIGATITWTGMSIVTDTITGFSGSSPYFGFTLQNNHAFDSHITEVTITYSVTTTIPEVPEIQAVYDYSLTSNASIVAPEVITTSSLIGGLYTEGTTITPEHVLTAYTDAKGTLSIDGSLHVADDLKVRNNITLQQDLIDLGTVVDKSTIPPSTINSKYVGQETGNILGFGFGYFYSSYANIYTYSAFSSIFTNGLAIGNTVRIGRNYINGLSDLWWDLQITGNSGNSSTINLSYNVINRSVYAANNGWNTPDSYSSSFTSGDNIGFEFTQIIPTQYVLHLDKNAIALTSDNRIGLNGAYTSQPTLTTVRVQGDKSSNSIYDTGSYDGMPNHRRIVSGSGSFLTSTTPSIKNISTIFSNGNEVSILWNGYIGVYTVSNRSLSYDMMQGQDTVLSFDLTFVSGHDFGNDMNYAFGMMLSTFEWSAVVTISINYTTEHLTQFANSTTSGLTYTSTASWDWLSVGDKLNYVPAIATLSFKKNDGSNVKAITYNNNTGTITYDGLKSLVLNNATNLTLYTDAGASTQQPSAYHSTMYGYNGWSGEEGVSIGYNARAGSNASNAEAYSTSIGAFTNSGYYGTTIGHTAQASNAYATSIGALSNAYGIKNTAIGYKSYVGSNLRGVTAWGGYGMASVRHQLYTWTYSGALQYGNTGTYYISTDQGYYGTNTSYNTEYGQYLPELLGYQDGIATIEVTTFVRKPSWAGGGDWCIYTQKYALGNPNAYQWTLNAIGSQTILSSSGNSLFNAKYSSELMLDGSYLYGRVIANNADYAQVAMKVEMKSATWSLN